MTLPPQPEVALSSPPIHVPVGRRCGACGSVLVAHGQPAFLTAGLAGGPDGALILEMFWCPGCGKVEFYSAR
jgi:hypothetical protein